MFSQFYIQLALIGVVVGAYGTMSGAGGGFLMVPILLIFFNINPQQAIGTSLSIVFIRVISGTLSYARQKRIDYKTAWNFALGAIPGSIIGSYVTRYFSSKIFNVIFGLILISVAIFLFIKPNPVPIVDKSRCFPFPFLKKKPILRELVDVYGNKFIYAFNMSCGVALCFIVGFLSGLLGIGGGIILVPALVFMFCFPVHISVATSTFVLAMSSLVGSGSHLLFGNVMFKYTIPIGIGAFIGSFIGAELSKIVKGPLIIRILAAGLIIVGIKLLFR